MNRRDFISSIVGAITGGFALKQIPAIAAPKLEPNALTFSKLMEAYDSCRFGKAEPDILAVSPTTYAEIMDLIGPIYRYTGPLDMDRPYSIKLLSMDVIPSPYVQRDTIQFISRSDELNPHINKTFRLSELA